MFVMEKFCHLCIAYYSEKGEYLHELSPKKETEVGNMIVLVIEVVSSLPVN